MLEDDQVMVKKVRQPANKQDDAMKDKDIYDNNNSD